MTVDCLHYNDHLAIIVCKHHGYALQPNLNAVTRHLRGAGHRLGRDALKTALQWASRLRLASTCQLKAAQTGWPNVVLSIEHLKIWDGLMCLLCRGEYLTTSADLLRRHARSSHDADTTDIEKRCQVQTLFLETKHRQYFMVTAEGPVPPAMMVENQTVHSPSRPLLMPHPYTFLARRVLDQIPENTLDSLFKSTALRIASRPLFDAAHVDSCANMVTTFRLSQHEPAFFSALVYSMVNLAQGETDLCLYLKAKSLESLQRQVADFRESDLSSIIGTILLLKTTAYKLGDVHTHRTHGNGLAAVMRKIPIDSLSSAARRAYFWQDLLASFFMRCLRSADTSVLPRVTQHLRPQLELNDPGNAEFESALPSGFQRYTNDLPHGLLHCVLAVQDLQATCRNVQHQRYSDRYEALDHAQANAESLLVDHRPISEAAGPLAYAIWLATFICSYCSWIEVWSDITLPCQLARDLLLLLIQELNSTRFLDRWEGRLDLFSWAMLIACSIADFDQVQSKSLQPLRSEILRSAIIALQHHGPLSIQAAHKQACSDFLYYSAWHALPDSPLL